MDHIKAAWRSGGTLLQYEAAARAYGDELTAALQRELQKANEERDAITRNALDALGFIVVGPSDNLSEVANLIEENNRLKRELNQRRCGQT
jgi:hypothetical protein